MLIVSLKASVYCQAQTFITSGNLNEFYEGQYYTSRDVCDAEPPLMKMEVKNSNYAFKINSARLSESDNNGLSAPTAIYNLQHRPDETSNWSNVGGLGSITLGNLISARSTSSEILIKFDLTTTSFTPTALMIGGFSATSLSTRNYALKEGFYRIQITHTYNVIGTKIDPQNPTSTIPFLDLKEDYIVTSSWSISAEGYPAFLLDNKAVNFVDVSNLKAHDAYHVHYQGCSDLIIEKRYDTYCQGYDFILGVQEFDLKTNSFVGNEISRKLTTNEANSYDFDKINVNTFQNAAGQSMNFQDGKYYVIWFVNVSLGVWKPSYVTIQWKNTDWDLAILDDSAPLIDDDNNFDDGFEPYTTNDDIFHSFDVWNLNLENPTQEPTNWASHQDPDFATIPTNVNKILVGITNLGCNESPDNTNTLRLFWTRARTTELWDVHWKYDIIKNAFKSTFDNTTQPYGGEITVSSSATVPYLTSNSSNIDLINIPSINGNTQYKSFSLGHNWYAPDPKHYGPGAGVNFPMSSVDARPIICFLARINEPTSSDDPIIWEASQGFPLDVFDYVSKNNNVATRNSRLYDESNFLVDHNNNGGGSDWDYGFVTVMANNPEASTRNVDLCVDLMPNSFPSDFRNYGRIEIGVTQGIWSSWLANGSGLSNSVSIISPLLLELDGTTGCIEDIDLPVNSTEQIGLRFVYSGTAALPSDAEQYNYRIREINHATETTSRGSHSIVEVVVPTVSPLQMQNKRDNKTTANTSVPTSNLLVYPNPGDNIVVVSIHTESKGNYKLTILDAHGKEVYSSEGESKNAYFSKSIDISYLRKGLYFVSYKDESQAITQKLMVR